MPDEPEPGSENDEAVSRFVDWVTHSTDEALPGGIRESIRPEFVRAVSLALEAEGVPWTLTLERVALIKPRGDAEWLLDNILSECWRIIRDFFTARPHRSVKFLGLGYYSHHEAISNPLLYIIIRLAPNTTACLQDLDADDLYFLTEASSRDLNIVRHLLTWASGAAENGEPYKWEPMARRLIAIFGTLARRRNEYRSKFEDLSPRVRPPWETYLDERNLESVYQFIWNSPAGVSLARRMIADVPLGQLIFIGFVVFGNRLEFLAELSKLSTSTAHSAGMDPSIIKELVEKAPRIDLSAPDKSPSKRRWPALYVVLPFIPVANLDQHPLIAGWVIGSELQIADVPRNVDSVAQLLQISKAEAERTELCGMALLWADLKQLAKYESESRWDNQEKIRGVLARLSRHRDLWPGAWAKSARVLLKQAKTLGSDGADLLTLAAVQHSSVRDVLAELAERDPEGAIRDASAGLLARAAGVAMPDEDLRQWLADTAARAFDGVPMFPHPLTPLARTWLGSAEVEEILSAQLRQAIIRFSDWARDQGAAQEELVTGVLLRELEAAFRETSLRLKAGGRRRLARAISVSQRPVSKTEEKRWGCDVALLLNADIRPAVALQLAELVQVKKSEAFARKPPLRGAFRGGAPTRVPDEKWRIDVPQLASLLRMSESSSYWLILSTGEVICVTARLLHGLVGGRHAFKQGGITVGYNEVRHAAVPVEQFLPEIFLGTWAGSLTAETLQFASGQDSNVGPRYIFEISVTGDQDR